MYHGCRTRNGKCDSDLVQILRQVTVTRTQSVLPQMTTVAHQPQIAPPWSSRRHWIPLSSWWWGTRHVDCAQPANKLLPTWLSWTDAASQLELYIRTERHNPFARPYIMISLVDIKNITVSCLLLQHLVCDSTDLTTDGVLKVARAFFTPPYWGPRKVLL